MVGFPGEPEVQLKGELSLQSLRVCPLQLMTLVTWGLALPCKSCELPCFLPHPPPSLFLLLSLLWGLDKLQPCIPDPQLFFQVQVHGSLPILGSLCSGQAEKCHSAEHRALSSPDVLLGKLALQDALLKVRAITRPEGMRREATHQPDNN